MQEAASLTLLPIVKLSLSIIAFYISDGQASYHYSNVVVIQTELAKLSKHSLDIGISYKYSPNPLINNQ